MAYALDKHQRDLVVRQTNKYIQQASVLFDRKIPIIPIKFDLTGRTIGMYKVVRRKGAIRYNEAVFAKYFADNLANTIPHEVAHYVVDKIYAQRGIRPHGLEWANVMAEFGAKPERLANYNLDGIAKRAYRTIPYQCDCQQHALGIRRHNKVVSNRARYHCRQCSVVLTQC